MIHGNITNKPLTRCAALRGPRRAGRVDRVEFAADFVAGLVDRFLATLFLTVLFFADRFLVAITCLPRDFQANTQLGHAPIVALGLRRFQPSQTTTA